MAKKPYRIGVDLGGTNIKVGIVDEQDRILAKKSVKTRAERPWQEVAKDIAELAMRLLAELKIDISECEKMGVGSPGMIDHINGVVVFAGNFNWDDIPLVTELRRYFSLPITLANDANCAALGETVAGAGKGARHVVLITLGTGVGGGVVADGILQQGGAAGGMELGHTLLMLDGEECTCGRRGCFEAYASANALARQGRRAAKTDSKSIMHEMCKGDLSNMNGAIPFKAAQKGDKTAQRVVDDYIRYLGEGLINCINVWRPEKVLLGGGISNEGAPLINPLNEYVRPRCFAGERGFVPHIEIAALGNDAGIIGAAAL
ncbi:ROK family protein [Ruminococcaceae bacterium OttesenSCG-928-A16]|nr:ROK family protein [Ruminococcaceae bacterium OttesenSCG-928-A16]